jgi:hypothetical protein
MGMARALALSRGDNSQSCLSEPRGSFVIERYSLPEGTLHASTPLDARAAVGGLDIAHKWILYSVGREIRIIGPLWWRPPPVSSAHLAGRCFD